MKTLNQFLEAAKLAYLNPLITENNFPDFESLPNEKTKLVEYQKFSSEKEIPAGEANLKELLQYAIDNPENKKDIVYVLGSGSLLRNPLGSLSVLCLYWRDGRWSLGLRWLESDWYSNGRVMRLRKVAGNSDVRSLEHSDCVSKQDFEEFKKSVSRLLRID